MLLEFKNIEFSFSGGKPLLDNASFDLEEKTVYALMGANGSGKTTLFNLLTGFIPYKKGFIIFCGHPIKGLAPHRINRKGISRTFQDLRLISKLTVKENVVLAMPGHPTDDWKKALLPESLFRKEIELLENRADRIIETCFLQDVRHSLAGEISYGQQKLLNLACCIASEAKLLLLDEPVAGIQPEYRKKIVQLIRQMKEEGKTILMIEHNTDFISEVADRIFFLHEGRLNSYHDMESLRADSTVIEAYM